MELYSTAKRLSLGCDFVDANARMSEGNTFRERRGSYACTQKDNYHQINQRNPTR